MKSVTVSKARLLDALRQNKREHQALLERAISGYKVKVKEWLEARMSDVEAGRKPKMSFCLPEPSNHTKDYSVAIKMVEWSTDDEIELSERDFRSYALNQWDWYEHALTTNMGYSTIASTGDA